ncbi:MAG: DUF2304 domain-containing protein [Thermoflexaceae bacterium]|nr:DUF2304 domain-containing protein [Thermoflexaceae bacterium]
MSIYLRILLIVVCVFTSQYVLYKIRKSQMKIEGALYWLFFSALILILSFFPEIGMAVSSWIGIESTANFIFLVIIFLLIIKVFFLSLKGSQIEYKLSVVIEELAIMQNRRDKEEKKEKEYMRNDKEKIKK